MGLGDLLFSKKSKTDDTARKTYSSPRKKNSINDVVVSPRYNIKKSLIGKDMRRLKTIKVDGKGLTKRDLENLMSSISKSNRRDITYKDLERFIKDPRRNKVIKGWRNKKKFLAIEKMQAKKGFKPDKEAEGLSGAALADRIKREARSARKVDAKDTLEGQKYISPKKSKGKTEPGAESSFSRLGITSVKEGFQMGHKGGLGSMSSSNAHSVEKNKSRGMVQTGSSDITRDKPRDLGGNSINSSIRPRQEGL